MPKYTFTDETINHFGVQLRRIKRVSDGVLGGFIEKEENLSQEGDCWVGGNAQVYGDARVFGDARVYGDARVFGDARVYRNAQVYENARVYKENYTGAKEQKEKEQLEKPEQIVKSRFTLIAEEFFWKVDKMFRCQNKSCNKIVQANQPQNRVITERREVTYEKKVKGWEIVKEITVCPKCFQKLTGKQPRLIIPKAIPQEAHRSNTRPPRRKKWKNPRDREGTSTRSAGSTSQQSSTTRLSQNSSPRKPIVEKVNPIPIIK